MKWRYLLNQVRNLCVPRNNFGGDMKLKSTKLDDVYHHGAQNNTNITNVRHLFITL